MSLDEQRGETYGVSSSSSSSATAADVADEAQRPPTSLSSPSLGLRLPMRLAETRTPEREVEPRQPDIDLPLISLNEVAWHDSPDSCWLTMCDNVYDCTDFLACHPGGRDVLLEYAGRDATLAFVGAGHSDGAKGLLARYLIGRLPEAERIFRVKSGFVLDWWS